MVEIYVYIEPLVEEDPSEPRYVSMEDFVEDMQANDGTVEKIPKI